MTANSASTANPSEEKIVFLTSPCPHCGGRSTVELYPSEITAWKRGFSIQRAFPRLSENERELILSGLHPQCWDEVFDTEDEH